MARLGRSQPFAPLIRRFVSSGSTPTNVTLVQSAWKWQGTAIRVNAKTQITLVLRSWKWQGTALSINAKTMLSLSQQFWKWQGNRFSFGAATATRLLTLLKVGAS